MTAPAVIVGLGDSTTAGTPGFLSPLEAPPDGRGDITSQYAWWLTKEHPEWRILNRGINGERSDEIRARFERDVIRESANLVVILAGVNDIYQGRSPEDVQRNLMWMYEQAGSSGIRVVACSIIPFDTATADQNRRMHAVNQWIAARAAEDPNVTFCDTRRAVARPDDPDRLMASPDGLHPAPEGYKQMAATIERAIAEALAAR